MATIVGIAAGNPNFSILVAAIGFIDSEKGTSYGATLDDPLQSLTVFAPTNDAFARLASDLGFAGDTGDEAAVTTFLTGLGADLLETVVTYHVLPGAQSAADISAAGTLTTLQGGVIDAGELPTLGDLEPDLINPSLIDTDIAADNGIVHVIDRVLIPEDLAGNDAKTITGIVLESGEGFDSNGEDFDLLREAVVAAGLAGTLDDVAADLTVFAPNDAAFIGLAQDLGYGGSDEEGAFGYIVDALTLLNNGEDPIGLLTQILTYHVAGESLQLSQVVDAGSVTTLQGGTLTVDGTSLVDADPDIANPNLVATDIQAANGIVHVLDGVLLPVDVLTDEDGDAAQIDLVIKGDGVDLVVTGRGDDLISTKGGNDIVEAGADDDLVLAGAGSDFVFGDDGDDKLLGESGNDILIGWDDDDTVDGGTGNDLLTGDGGDDIMSGGAGDDDLLGGSGDDDMSGDGGTDIMLGGRGDDTVDGGDGNDIVLGGRDDDIVLGGAGDDILLGESGDDTMTGGTGDDYHIGGGGDDVFVFASGDGTDIIQDFRLGHDDLDVSAFGFESFSALSGAIDGGFGFTEVKLDAETNVILLGVNANALDADDFIL
ncbi:fasciclin domain-containing protein [Primorskyibacter sp. S187A]|uniref:fasciclin domain-containing protein n=1 Tax=Primorskyibacter sp. S187A TaxID=3415130 RepID=UPI003C7C7E69